MPRLRIATAAVCASLLAVPLARAQTARTALVAGSATYSALPGIPGCARSANVVAAALRALNFDVTDRPDASTGGVSGGIAEFADHLAAGKGTGFVYVCGYATDFNDRTFLLPVTAKIERPSDVMTQGVLAKAVLSGIGRDPATMGVVIFDLIAKPDGPPKIALDALVALPVPDGVGIIAATETAPADAPTPLAAAVVSALAGPAVRTEGLLTAVQTQLTGAKATTLVAHMPVAPGYLAGAPPPPVARPAAAPPPAATPPAAPPAAPAPAATPPVAATPLEPVPDEAQMTDADRKKVQSALVRLGYYDNPIDAVFGPETRAAIRRYQHEIGGEMTGRLTAQQATKLVNTR